MTGHQRISIAASEDPVVAGDKVVVFGRLRGRHAGHQVVTLWHRVRPNVTFTRARRVSTDARGFYAFRHADGVVNSNRDWFVTAAGTRSRRLREPVFALVTVSGPAEGSNFELGHPVTFTGTVSPFEAGDVAALQRQGLPDTGRSWRDIETGHVQPGGTFSITHAFSVPGDATLRVLVKATQRNVRSVSDVLSYEASQAQNPAFTINPSADPIATGQPVTLSGTLQGGGGATVTLLAKTEGQSAGPVGSTVADSSGNYSFTEVPPSSEVYQATGPGSPSAQIFVGVSDQLTASVSRSSVRAGRPVTFSGSIAPDKTGHAIYLQVENPTGGGFHTVQVGTAASESVFSLTRGLFVPGARVFRVLIPGGPLNEGAVSQPFTVTVTPASARQLSGSRPDSTAQG